MKLALPILLLPCTLLALACGDEGSDADAGPDADSDTDIETDSDGCAVGDFKIHDYDDMYTLEPYPCITGGLVIHESQVSSLSLPNLEWVGGSLSFNDNEFLHTVEMSAFESVGQDLEFCHNDAVTNLDGLSNINSVGRHLHIRGNDTLSSLEALSSITTVPENLLISNNDALTNLDGLSNVTWVGELNIHYNEALTDIGGLGGVTSIDDSLSVYENHTLPDCQLCELLAQLTSAPQSINVSDNLEDECTPVPDNCEPDTDPCPDYTGDDPCCHNHNPCGWDLNDICDCDSTCAWDAVDCEW